MIPLLLFLAIPAAEIFLFIEVGGQIGTWPTIAMIFGTAIIGGTILRYQGRQMIERAREQVARHEMPVAEIAQGAVLVVAALLLLTPGFITDALGALLLIPILRRLVLGLLLLAIRARLRDKYRPTDPGAAAASDKVIDGEFEDISSSQGADDSPGQPGGQSGIPPPRIDRE
ncbi:MAG: FxsA family protein [Proteobacteria bacterium]|nr:FxsA family protein [Pseudomonadota bacterium]MDA1356213.1 FxsA family protein [Pseudomonadota bacterium]